MGKYLKLKVKIYIKKMFLLNNSIQLNKFYFKKIKVDLIDNLMIIQLF